MLPLPSYHEIESKRQMLHRNHEAHSYFASSLHPYDLNFSELYREYENTPRSQWPVRNGKEDKSLIGVDILDDQRRVHHWAELTDEW